MLLEQERHIQGIAVSIILETRNDTFQDVDNFGAAVAPLTRGDLRSSSIG